jgi:thymidylate synthase-like protein
MQVVVRREVATADDLVMLALSDLLDPVDESHVQACYARGYKAREILGWQATLTDVRSRLCINPVRDLRMGYCAAKVAWDLMELDDPEPLLFWNPNGRWYIDEVTTLAPQPIGGVRFPVNKRVFYGESYGQRLLPQLRYNMEMLKSDRSTRRAMGLVWKPSDSEASSRMKNVPCCIGMRLILKDDHLESQVVMRSNSVGVLPYDVFLFSTLHELIANELGADCGPMHWIALSMHVYEKEVEQRTREYDWYLDNDARSPQMRPLPFYAMKVAATRWWRTMNSVMAGDTVQMRDDVEQLFWEGYPREA